MICWVRIDQRVGYKLIESGYGTSEPGYKSSGYERSMGTKRLVSAQNSGLLLIFVCLTLRVLHVMHTSTFFYTDSCDWHDGLHRKAGTAFVFMGTPL